MKKHMIVLAGMYAMGCLVGILVSHDEPVVDGLAQSNGFLIMEKMDETAELEWVTSENVLILPTSESYVPVQGIPIDEEKAQLNRYVISLLEADIAEAFRTYNPSIWYRMDSAYVDSISQSVDLPGQYRIVVNVHTENTIERLVFDVETNNKAKLIRYSQMQV